MTVSRGLFIDGSAQIKVIDNRQRTQVKDLTHSLFNLERINLFGSESLNVQAHRCRLPNSVSDLNLGTVSKTGTHNVLGNPTHGVCCRTINLRGVLARERTPAVTSRTAIGINNNLATGQTGIAYGTTLHKTAGRVHNKLRVRAVKLGGIQHRSNHVFDNIRTQIR